MMNPKQSEPYKYQERMISMKECYICGRKTGIQYFDFVDGRFVLKEKCLNPYCRRYNKWAVK